MTDLNNGLFAPILALLDVPENGTIVVAGCYKGDYVDHLSGMFPTANIIGYEPQFVPWMEAHARFNHNPRIRILHAGLGTATRQVKMSKPGTVGASMVGEVGQSSVELVDAVEALHNLPAVDLFVMNVEGYEWVLLPHLLNEMMHHRIRRMAIQFHEGFASTLESGLLLDRLNNHYNCLHWNYPTWTYWKRKNI